MSGPARREVAPAVFDFVRDYADEVIEASKKRTVPQVSLGPLTVFVDNFFAQFFRAALNTTISGFSTVSREKASKARQKLESKSTRPEAALLISSYETYCRLHPDIEQERSVPDEHEALAEAQSALLEGFLPELFDRAEAWAAKEQESLIDAINEARENLDSARVELGLE